MKENKTSGRWINTGYIIQMGDNRKFAKEMIRLVVYMVIGVFLITMLFAYMIPNHQIESTSTTGGPKVSPFTCIWVTLIVLVWIVRALLARYYYKKDPAYYDALAAEYENRRLHKNAYVPPSFDPYSQWECPHCGAINSDYVGTCGCGTRKPPNKKK